MTQLLIGLILAIASFWLPREAIDPMARALIPAVALLATAIFPCMSLAVGSMKGDQRAPKQVEELYEQLLIVMRVLVLTFGLAALTIITVVLLVGLVTDHNPSRYTLLGERGLLGIVCVVLAILGGRVSAVGRAFFAILDINKKHALLIARAKVQGGRDNTIERWRTERFSPDNQGPAHELEKVD